MEVDIEEEVATGLQTLIMNATHVLTHLAPDKAAQLLQVLHKAPSLFIASPVKKTLIKHVVYLKDGRPIQPMIQRP